MIEHLWRGEGHRFIAWLGFDLDEKGKRKLHQRKFPTTEKALKYAHAKNADGHDVWFSCALFSGDRRQQKCVSTIGGFWIDFDVKPTDSEAYPTRAAAMADIKRMVTELKMPKPTVVSSGRGYHVYWLLEDRLSNEEWRPVALNLKRFLAAKGIKQDPMRTADSASIMRIPGTLHLKDAENPLKVEVLRESTPVSLERIKKVLPFVPAATGKSSFLSARRSYEGSATAFSGRRAAEKCAQLAHLRDTGGDVSEPLWYGGIGIAVHASEGEELAHEWSRGYKGYSEAETGGKFLQRKNSDMGPTTCEHFGYLNPKGCEGCPLAGKIKTPLSAGKQLKVEKKADGTTDELIINNKWQVTSSGVMMLSDEDEPKMVFSIPFKLMSVGVSEEGEACAFVQWRTPKGSMRTGELPLTIIGEQREMRKWLYDKAIVQFFSEVRVMQYMKDYATMLQNKADPDLTARTFGWTPDGGFVIGSDKYTADGKVIDVRVNKKINSGIRKALKKKGTAEAWTKGTASLDSKMYDPHKFAILAALASPVLHITNVSGAVLSLAGQSGSGKSIAERYALSAWGDPNALMSAPDGTMVSRDVKMKFLKNIPLGIDDLSGEHLKSPHMKNMVYQAVNGQAKERGTQDGGLQDQATWNLIMLITTNNPLMDQPKFTTEAERRRMVELSVSTPMEPDVGEELYNVSSENYGAVGRELIQLIIKHREKLSERVRALSKKWISDPNIPEANRFGVWLCAAAMVVGKLAYSKGLIAFDPVPAVEFAIDELRNVSKIMLSPEETMQEALASFVNSNLTSISYSKNRKWADLGTVHHKIVARMDFDTQLIYIPAGQLRAWLGTLNISASLLNVWVKENKIERNKQILMTMKGSREKCYCIPWDVHDMAVHNLEGE